MVMEPLVGVAVVCREHQQIGAIEAVVHVIDAFVDPAARWTVTKACARSPDGLLRLLSRITAQEPPDLDLLLRHQTFTRALVQAVQHHDVAVVQWLVEEYFPTGKIREPVREAAACGQVEILQWLYANHASRMVWSNAELELAAEHNHFATVQWLFTVVPRDSARRFDDERFANQLRCWALKNGNLGMLKWVDDQQELDGIRVERDIVESGLILSAENGNRDIMAYLCERFGCRYTHRCLQYALLGGQLEVAQWLHQKNGIVNAKASDLQNAALNGQVEMIAWALETLELDDKQGLGSVIDAAAGAGHLNVIQMIHEHYVGGKCSTMAMDKAAQHGHLDVVKWLHANRTEGCTILAMDRAAGLGHLDVVQFLHANRHEGCSTFAMDWAATNNHLSVVEWLHLNRNEGCTALAMDAAAVGGHLEMVKWLHRHRTEGCSTRAMGGAAANGHLEVVKWLHHNRSEGCTTRAMDSAAAGGHLEAVEWLHSTRKEGCSDLSYAGAAFNCHVEVVRWLASNKPEAMGRDAIAAAVKGGSFELLWTIDKLWRSKFEIDTSLFEGAIEGEQYEVLDWLLCEYGDVTPGLDDWLHRGTQVGDLKFNSYVRDILADRLEQ